MNNEVNELLDKLGELEDAPLIWINKKVYDTSKEVERLNKELQDTKEHLGEYLYEEEEENKRLIKELKIKTDFIEELLYLILNSTDNKLQKEVHKIGIKYDKNIQELKGDCSNENS